MIATGTFNENGALLLNFEHYYKVTFNETLGFEFEETDAITNFKINTVDYKTVSAYINDKPVSAILPAGSYEGGSTALSVFLEF